MIIGIGTDIVSLPRFARLLEKHYERVKNRIFTEIEWRYANSSKHDEKILAKLAARFAAKEACAKALGTGFGKHASFHEIGVVNIASGQPTLQLTGTAALRLSSITPAGKCSNIWLSLTDEEAFAQAFVVIEAR